MQRSEVTGWRDAVMLVPRNIVKRVRRREFCSFWWLPNYRRAKFCPILHVLFYQTKKLFGDGVVLRLLELIIFFRSKTFVSRYKVIHFAW